MGNWKAFVKEVAPQMRFMRRGDVEEDPTTSQVIPYVVIRNNNRRVLVYNRGSKGGEARLSNKWSIGFGGHINLEDMLGCQAEADIILIAAAREISEELKGITEDTMENDFQVLGFLYLTDTPVDEVHFGVVLEVVCWDPTVLAPTDEANQLAWEDSKGLRNYELENWSKIVRDKFY